MQSPLLTRIRTRSARARAFHNGRLTHLVLSCTAKLPPQCFIVKDSTIFASENSWSSCSAILDNSHRFGTYCLARLRHKISRAIGDILSSTIKPFKNMKHSLKICTARRYPKVKGKACNTLDLTIGDRFEDRKGIVHEVKEVENDMPITEDNQMWIAEIVIYKGNNKTL